MTFRGGKPGWALLVCLGMLLSCTPAGPPLPASYPVKGIVRYKSGQPLAYGSVEMRSTTDSTKTANGQILPDGTFTLGMIVGVQKVAGAVAGPHHVTVFYSKPEDHDVKSVQLPEPITIQEGENDLKLTIPIKP